MKGDRPPPRARACCGAALLAGVLTVALSATAVASAVLLEIDDVTQTFTREGRQVVDIPEVTRAQAGDPRTFLILGSDARYADKNARHQAALGHDPARPGRSGHASGSP